MSYFDLYKLRLQAEGNDEIEVIKNNTKNFINNNFKKSPVFKIVYIEGIQYEVLLNNHNKFDKVMLLQPDTKINIGDLVLIDAEYYLVIDFIYNELYPKAYLFKCNNTLQWKDKNGNNQIVPCVVINKMKLSEVKEKTKNDITIILPQDEFIVIVQYNNDTKKIKHLQKFTINERNWEVKAIDNITRVYNGKGTIQMKLVSIPADSSVQSITNDSGDSWWN